MFQTYEDALDWIHGRLRLGIKPGLKRMEWMMERLGNPEKKLKAVHIGGTNGKGSTVTFLRSILETAGYSVGTFTSPYIEYFNERISVNGNPVTDEELVELANKIKPLSDELDKTDLGGPTEFEVITAMSFIYFADVRPVDFAIYEVGLGGRFDSTNILKPLLSVITNVGLDHISILGDTYTEIAFEKAGIIKEGIPVLTATQNSEALAVIREQAADKNARLLELGKEIVVSGHTKTAKGEKFTMSTPYGQFSGLEVSMIGAHQTQNAALAVTAMNYLIEESIVKAGEGEIRKGLKDAFWPGRLEMVSENPVVILDGAHNTEGIESLINELHSRFVDRNIHIVFAALKDKPLGSMISSLEAVADRMSFVSFDFPRAASAEELASLGKKSNSKPAGDWRQFLHKEINNMEEGWILVITGSLYFISEARRHLLGNIL
ncbi:bifunctional folylpolyglutamate synthase/dihydrofolate synthase [Neobacillus notoginsengisoli]|uniref:Dihydrofolate synthase/folylpolyglutamate synthase n=1 Tax=Neobacillus notoginsengisoli TaxID=1578198 RepID=A0A417YUL2_9BACI|nr:folylpolyglutamate synthase/dihydrofolate synthase family protein [Neobacillus notoginsengisoli]RHW40839.1 bifunctional folylpolyglutamate synthase/dihydrofolate synthase [Neobacillus notoginsengisoli]